GVDGNPLPYAPKWSESLDGEYDFGLGEDLGGFVGGRVSYVGRRFSDFSTTAPQTALSGYTTVSLRAGLRRGPFEVELFAKNLGDVRGITSFATETSALTGAVVESEIAVIQPRTVGIQLSARL
ncbi:MAG: TonB-dependent receptor domain-containing protein, partial [Caulobacteraceae bacterium]